MMLDADQITLEEIVDLALGLLAGEQGRDPAELRAELEQSGKELPIDSQLLVEILTRMEETYGVSIPADAQVARSLQSVHAFAGIVLDAIIAQRQADRTDQHREGRES